MTSQKIEEDLEDAENELMLTDEEDIRFIVGECFVSLDKDAAEARLASLQSDCKARVQEANAEIEDIKEQLKVLKKELYGRFGNSINLEEDVPAK